MDRNSGSHSASAEASNLVAIEGALIAIRRSQTRRALSRLSEQRRARPHSDLPDTVFELLDAVAAAVEPVAVTDAAAMLSVDQPRASRLVAQAIAAGLLRREADQRDGRRSLLKLTPSGHRTLEGIRDFRRQVIAEALAEWTTEDQANLAGLLTRFVGDFTAVTGPREG